MNSLDGVLQEGISKRATDIHIEEGKSAYFRIGAYLQKSTAKVEKENFNELYNRIGQGHILETLSSWDGAFTFEEIRIRIHFFKVKDHQAATLRILYNEEATLTDSDDDQVLKEVCNLSEGLVLVTGPTGSGKSYTLASCIQHINTSKAVHIVTLEDPVEFMFTEDRALIHQRQLGSDLDSMALGIRDALREDPDVIMVGELRDRPTLEAAFHAAETGHLVFATMHTQRSIMAINRMITMFPSDQQEEVRSQLSQILKAVFCQRLLYVNHSYEVVRDILCITPAVANLIRQRKEPQIVSIQETTKPMQTLEMALKKLEQRLGSCKEIDDMRKSLSV